jgi:hypothetical protein
MLKWRIEALENEAVAIGADPRVINRPGHTETALHNLEPSGIMDELILIG